jgi:ATP-dependent DNA helicase RecQ
MPFDPPDRPQGVPSPHDILRRVFGFQAFRGLQEQAITHVAGGGDALVLMPTGGGKSLCYQIPAICRRGPGIVVSPLIALMDDQVAALRQAGVAAGALHSERDPADARATARALEDGSLDLLYVSPERLLMEGTRERIARAGPSLIAIDEAHCVSQWGHEFRPEYRQLRALWPDFPGVPRVALTATADRRTRDDILAALDIAGAEVFAASFHRENLVIGAAGKDAEQAQLLAFLRRHEGEAGIVYCGTRARTERTAAMLVAKGIDAVAFHAGLDPDVKRRAATRFRGGEPIVVVATIAFGMGIDRPDVRFVVHLDMPDSPEAYYQQIGRAGRDGTEAETLLLYGAEDIARARSFHAVSTAPEAQRTAMRSRLEAMIALTESPACRTRALLACFGETLDRDCGHCDNCRASPVLEDATEDARKLLSAVHRTGGRFGAAHVAAVLRGETGEAVLRHSHDTLSVFGIGADRPATYWRALIRHLVVLGALDVATGDYPTLSLAAEAARPILRGEQPVAMREAVAASRTRNREARKAHEETPEFATLRAWRLATARAQGVPPYVIFHDSVLQEIAANRPATLADLAAIKGVGQSKLARYGEELLAALG